MVRPFLRAFAQEIKHTCSRSQGQGVAQRLPLGRELTHTHRRLSRPLVVLQAYPHGGAHQPEAGVALVHHRVPVAEAVPADVAVHDGVRGATVAGCRGENTPPMFPRLSFTNLFTCLFIKYICVDFREGGGREGERDRDIPDETESWIHCLLHTRGP